MIPSPSGLNWMPQHPKASPVLSALKFSGTYLHPLTRCGTLHCSSLLTSPPNCKSSSTIREKKCLLQAQESWIMMLEIRREWNPQPSFDFVVCQIHKPLYMEPHQSDKGRCVLWRRNHTDISMNLHPINSQFNQGVFALSLLVVVFVRETNRKNILDLQLPAF